LNPALYGGLKLNKKLPNLSIEGQFFLSDNNRFTVIECSDYVLYSRFINNENIKPQLDQRAEAGFNFKRVWTNFDERTIGFKCIPSEHVNFYDAIPEFINLNASYDSYVEFTAFVQPQRQEIDHWTNLNNACRELPVLIELVNENDQHPIDLRNFSKFDEILTSHGSNGSEHWSVESYWDYLTFHTNDASEEQRKVGHNAMEIWNGPVITNETSRYPEVGMWVNSDLNRQRNLAFDSAAGASLLCAGSCFHMNHGSEVWDNNTFEIAKEWVRGAKSIDLNCQSFPYIHRQDLEGPDDLRVYQKDNCFVKIRK